MKFTTLCKIMSSNLDYANEDFKTDLERVINEEDNWVDKSIIIPYILDRINVSLIKTIV